MCKVSNIDFYNMLMQLMESVNRLDASVRALTDFLDDFIDFEDIDWDIDLDDGD